MARYTIKYACGHGGDIQIFGPYKDRDYKAEQEAKKLCPECYKAKITAERAAESAAAAEQAKADGLPALTGSDKQIAWAESIRAKAAAQLSDLIAKLDAAPADADQSAKNAIAIARGIIAEVLAQREARFWIDNRGTIYDHRWISARTKAKMDEK